MSPFTEETAVEHVRGRLLDGDRIVFNEIEGSIAIKDGPGLQEWRGRFWLPESDQVEAGRMYRLFADDGRRRGTDGR